MRVSCRWGSSELDDGRFWGLSQDNPGHIPCPLRERRYRDVFIVEISAVARRGATGYRLLVKTTATARPFWQGHPGLLWSNPNAGDSARIRAALLRPRFAQLLDITLEFGVERVRQEWTVLRVDGTREVERAKAPVERALRHIEEGFARAAARH